MTLNALCHELAQLEKLAPATEDPLAKEPTPGPEGDDTDDQCSTSLGSGIVCSESVKHNN